MSLPVRKRIVSRPGFQFQNEDENPESEVVLTVAGTMLCYLRYWDKQRGVVHDFRSISLIVLLGVWFLISRSVAVHESEQTAKEEVATLVLTV